MISLRQWYENYSQGKYNNAAGVLLPEAGWYNYYCESYELVERITKFGQIIAQIDNVYLLDKYYVQFENVYVDDNTEYDSMALIPFDSSKSSTFVIHVNYPEDTYRYTIATERTRFNREFHTNDVKRLLMFLNVWPHYLTMSC